MLIIYVAERNSDLTEGRGHLVPIAYFLKREDAIAAAKGWGVMGIGDGEVHEIRVYESKKDWQEGEKKRIAARALSKLTDEERKALDI